MAKLGFPQWLAFLIGCAVFGAHGGIAWAQPSSGERIAEEPTDGVNLPGVGITGTHDATTVAKNPAGLHFLSGSNFALALDLGDEDNATGAGAGIGLYMGSSFGGKVLPKMSLGVGLEFMQPPRVLVTPDPGEPTRLTIGSSLALGKNAAFGTAWRRFFDSDALPLDGVGTWDMGFSARFGSHWAGGFVVRDVFSPTVGTIPVQRRHELEIVSRPFGDDRLELGVGGRIGETRGDIDGWLRWSAKLVKGIYFRGDLETRELHIVDQSTTGMTTQFERREYRLSAGLEFSFGGAGVTGYATGVLDENENTRFRRGATTILRLSEEHVPSLIPTSKRIEKIRLGAVGERGLTGLVLRLRAMARDPNVVALYLHIDGFAAGWGSTQEIRNELLALRKKGKKVFVYMLLGSTRSYYLASAADKIYVDPAGGVRMAGFAGTSIYFKGMFDKLGLNAQFEKIEEYKSAPESWTRTGPTEPAKRMRNELYDSLFDELLGGVATGRKITKAQVRKIFDDGPYTAGDLKGKTTIVDAIAEPKQVGKLIAKELGGVYPVGTRPKLRSPRWSYPEIAVIYITGDIVDGESQNIPVPIFGRRLVGSKTVMRAIRAARANPKVKAIVLRIDSPGGSAMASEKMAREVFKTRGVKPIICSMGDIAASGGYFAAAGCDKVFADPMTITGSIGIFYGKFDISGLLSRLGLNWRTFKRGKRSDMESYFRPYTDAERKFIKERLHYMYGRFTKAVADGRNMTQSAVNDVGRGHVWTGVQAMPIKLIDTFGGVGDAIAYAKAKAGIGKDQRARVVFLPKSQTSLLKRLTGLPFGKAKAQPAIGEYLLRWLPGGKKLLEALPWSLLAEPNQMQMRLPFSILWGM